MSKQVLQQGEPKNIALSVDSSKQVPLNNDVTLNIDAPKTPAFVKNLNVRSCSQLTASLKNLDSKKAVLNNDHNAAMNLDQSKQAACDKKLNNNVASNVDNNNRKGKADASAVDDFSKPWLDFMCETCSCASCDPYHCFALRHHSGVGCTCKSCSRDGDCNFYNNLMNNLDFKSKQEKNDNYDSENGQPSQVNVGKIEENIILKPPSNGSLTSTCSSKIQPCNTCKPMLPLDDYELHSYDRRSSNISKHKPIPTIPLNEDEHIHALVKEYVRRELQDLTARLTRPAVEEVEKVNTLKEESKFSCKSYDKSKLSCKSNEKSKLSCKSNENSKFLCKLNEESKLPCKVDEDSKPISKSDASTSYTGFIDMMKSLFGINRQSCKIQTDEIDNKNGTNTKKTTDVKTSISNIKDYKEVVEIVEKQLLEPEEEVEVTALTNSRTSAGQLKAEIMSVPYKVYQRSVPQIKRPINTKMDLLERIKEVYKACSCKLCQCISVGPTQTVTKPDPEKCSCKPCNCDECSRLKKTELEPNEALYLEKYPEKDKTCDCVMCGCIKCQDSFAKSCSCKPCECVDCTSKLTNFGSWKRNKRYVIATVQEGPNCSCSPCGCYECGTFDSSDMRSRLMHDMGTDERRHLNCNCDSCSNDNCEQEGADTCNCDRHTKLMRKPVIKDTDEYDVRYALKCNKNNPIHDTLTMFATVPNRPNPNTSNVSEDSTQYEFENENVFSNECDFWPERQKVKSRPKLIQEPCDCKPCECIKCQKHFLEGHIASERTAQNCSCEICECINSIDLGASYNAEKKYKYLKAVNSRTDVCNCIPCNCIDCKKYLRTCMHEEFENQIPGSNPDIKDEPPSSLKVFDENHSYIKLLKDAPDPNTFIDLILTDKESKNYSDDRQKRSLLKDESKFYKGVKHNNIVSYSNSHVGHSAISEPLQSSPVRENTVSRINTSNHILGYQESKTISAPVLSINECNSIRQNRRSYDSCEHDYLYGSPTSTVETCIHDVMNTDGIDICTMKLLKPFVKIKSDIENFKYSNFISSGRITNTEISSNLKSIQQQNKKSIYYNSENLYDCGISDCAKYTGKLPNKNCNCDCNGCSCDFIPCLDLGDKTMYIRKNEITQTAEYQENKIYNTMKMKDSDCIPSFLRVKSSHLRSSLKKHTVSFDADNIDLTSKRSTEYNNIKKTLQESRLFSLELLNKLQKYERANKEFESIIEKYKNIQGILGGSTIFSKNISKKEPTVNDKCKDFEDNADWDSKTNNSLNKINETTEIKIQSKPINFVSSLDKKSRKNQHIDKIKTAFLKKLEEYEQSNKRIKEIAEKYRKTQESVVNTRKIKNTKLSELNEIEANKNLEYFRSKMKTDTSINHAIDDIAENSFLTLRLKTLRDSSDNLCYDDKTDPYKIYSAEKPVSNVLITNEKEKAKKSLKDLEQQFMEFSETINKATLQSEKQVWPKEGISESEVREEKQVNMLSGYGFVDGRRDQTITPAPKVIDIKKQDEHKSFISVKKLVTGVNSNKLQQKHRDQVLNDCLLEETTISKPVNATIIGYKSTPTIVSALEHSVCSGAVSSFATNLKAGDSAKVNIRTIRKVSRHTILVEWKPPVDPSNVFGYEVIVDGRTVQQVQSPMKTLAIITGLPHSNRVLITIKTLLVDPGTRKRMPCATCVYDALN